MVTIFEVGKWYESIFGQQYKSFGGTFLIPDGNNNHMLTGANPHSYRESQHLNPPFTKESWHSSFEVNGAGEIL